jgi:hypothetical protein
MTARGEGDSFGPYAFTLSPAETEAAAARFGLRAALRGGLIASHLAPLTAFALVLVFASILALTGFVSRRAGESAVLLAAATFMIQRLATHWRIRRARALGRTALEALAAGGALAARIDESGVALEGGGRSLRFDYADCEDAEDAGGLVYVWRREGAPLVLPARALGEGETGRLVAHVRSGIIGRRIAQGRTTATSRRKGRA